MISSMTAFAKTQMVADALIPVQSGGGEILGQGEKPHLRETLDVYTVKVHRPEGSSVLAYLFYRLHDLDVLGQSVLHVGDLFGFYHLFEHRCFFVL